MSDSFIYIGTYTVKDSMLEEGKRRLHQLVELVEQNEPRTPCRATLSSEAEGLPRSGQQRPLRSNAAGAMA